MGSLRASNRNADRKDKWRGLYKYAAYKVHVMGMEMVYSEIGHELKPHVMIHSVTQIKLKSKT